MQNKQFICGNDAVALGVKLSRPNVISAYPITPQTIAVERLSDFVEDGSLKSKYIYAESEHSALSIVMGSAAVGARTFTATSSQGLLYMCEVLHYASGGRFPLVMMNANRAIALPWNIYNDHTDSMSQLNSGWIQLHVEDAQEALDTIIQAYKIAEDAAVMTPVMINLDGFLLTHTYEVVMVPEQEAVDSYLPPFVTRNKMDLDDPKCIGITAGPETNLEYKYKQARDMDNARAVIKKADEDYARLFGRGYSGLVEGYRLEGAESVLVTVGSLTSTARVAVDRLREQDKAVGLLKLRSVRPFPEQEIASLLKSAKRVGVIDKSISYGLAGTIYTEVAATLGKNWLSPLTHNFIGGLGGRDISLDDLINMYGTLDKLSGKEPSALTYVGLKGGIDG